MTVLRPTQVFSLIKQVSGGSTNTAGMITATAIVLAESGGDTAATHKNSDGSIDRGLFQINSKAHPDLSAVAALDPQQNAAYAFKLSNGWTNFGAWASANGTPSKGLTDLKFKILAQDASKGIDSKVGGVGIGDIFTAGTQAVGDIPVIGTGLKGIELVGEFFGKLLNPAFWKRLGVGALGAIVVLVAIGLLFRKPIEENVSTIAKGAAVA